MSAALSRVPELVHVAAPATPAAVSGVVLVLPGGSVKSVGRYRTMPEWGLRPLLQCLALVGADHGIAVCLLRYRVRGWNGESADPLADTRWALEELDRKHGGVPCVLVGNSLGGRAAFRAAGAPHVVGVAGIAPWLPEGEPVDQLTGREALILHGDKDRSEAGAEKSLEFASAGGHRARNRARGRSRREPANRAADPVSGGRRGARGNTGMSTAAKEPDRWAMRTPRPTPGRCRRPPNGFHSIFPVLTG
jgi:alpha-beta hydrolase superfamily lysophospholipase